MKKETPEEKLKRANALKTDLGTSVEEENKLLKRENTQLRTDNENLVLENKALKAKLETRIL